MTRKDRPIITDEQGRRRFKANAVVVYLLDEASAGCKCSLNELATQNDRRFTQADWHEFYQLIGYSLDGYAEIFPNSKERT